MVERKDSCTLSQRSDGRALFDFKLSMRTLASALTWIIRKISMGQRPCIRCYLSAFTCLYDLLQFDFRSDSERRSDETSWERVMLKSGVEVSKGEVEDEAEAEVDAESGRYDLHRTLHYAA